MQRCSICSTLIQTTDQKIVCRECGSSYHSECWEKIGGCATYGCASAAVPEVSPPMPTSVRGGWGDEKPCPKCDLSIPASAVVCGCGARFPWADPMTRKEYDEWVVEEERRVQTRRQLIVLFIITLSGLLAPLSGALAGVQAYRSRHLLSEGSGAYLALGYGSTIIGAFYVLIFLLLYLNR